MKSIKVPFRLWVMLSTIAIQHEKPIYQIIAEKFNLDLKEVEENEK